MAELLTTPGKNNLFNLKKEDCQLLYDTLVLACNHLIKDKGVSRFSEDIIRRRVLMSALGKAIKY